MTGSPISHSSLGDDLIFDLHREYVQQEDLTKAARKVAEAKKHESQFLLFLSSLTN